MKRKLIYLILFVFALGIACKQTEKKKEIKQYTIEQFYNNKQFFGSSFSSDESKLLLTTKETGIYNACSMPIDSGAFVMLTKSDKESVYAISYFPNDERFLYSSDKGGNEISHIFVQNTDGTSQDLTPWEKAKSDFWGWSHDQKSFYFISNKRDNRFFDLYEMDIETMKEKMIFENKEGYDFDGISNDKTILVLGKSITTSNNELYLYNFKTKKLQHLTQHEGDARYSAQFFTLDNKELYFITDEGGEFTYLMKYNLETGTKEKVFETGWNVAYAYQSFNEKYRVIAVDQDAKNVLRVIDLKSGQEIEMPKFDDGDILGVSISKSEKLMSLSVGSSTSPSDIYMYNFETKSLKRLTKNLNPEINQSDLVAAQVIRYKSYDGLDIPSILYKPHTADADNKVPAVLFIHGGPGGQTRVGYSSFIQYLVNHGYVVLGVNNRGSSGYGKTFFKADDRKHGEADLKDCIESKKYLASLGYVDTTKIGIIGGSYGGYMVMAALTFAPDEFEVGVNIFGVTNWLRTLKSIPPFWESFRKALYAEMGDPNTADSVRLYKISPLFHAQNVKKPLMVLQGANDPRVLQIESDEIVAAVKKNNVPVEYVLFPDEGHGFQKKENEINGYGKVLQFLDKFLKKTDAAK